MRGTPTTFWGKLEKDEGGTVVAWHPLIHHCADVAACTLVLLDRSILGRRLARLAGWEALDATVVERLAALAAFHDVGKFNHGFQYKAHPQPPRVGHVSEGAQLVFADNRRREEAHEALGVAKWLPWGLEGVAERLLLASIGHHGRPPTEYNRTPDPHLWSIGDVDPVEGIDRLRQATEAWLPRAFQNDTGVPPLPREPAFEHGFAGLVMLADWFGSDRRYFEYSEHFDAQLRFRQAVERAREAIREMGVDVREARRSLGPGEVRFSSISEHPSPRPAQAQVASLPLPAAPSVTVLEAETGSGKTEAAVWRFLQLLRHSAVDGMYFALPTRSAATQIYGRVVQALERAFPEPETRPPCVLAVPGYLSADGKEGLRLPGFEVLWPDHQQQRYRAWASEHPKRYLMGAVVVGTIDQVLLSVLRVPHAHMRQTALLRHLLVVDEVHASDAYMGALSAEVLVRHRRAGGHALLMSATLGSVVRQQLLGSHAQRFDEAAAVAYPAISHREGDAPATTAGVCAPGSRKACRVRCVPTLGDERAVADRAVGAARKGARVLVIRNTVAGCLAVQREVEQRERDGVEPLSMRLGDAPVPHHSRYCPDDRKALDRAVETALSPKAPAGRGVVVVATQTVEQSLDVDADLLLTDLCPMDVLLQRIGRLHRHRRARPAGFETATAEVLVPDAELGTFLRKDGKAWGPHGLGTVYEDLTVLLATWRCLEAGSVTVPDDCRRLVEETTHPERLAALAASQGDAWVKHSERTGATRLADRRLADLQCVDWTSSYFECGFPEDLEQRAKTRLNDLEERRVEMLRSVTTPFGHVVREIKVPGTLARDLVVDGPVDGQEDASGFAFHVGPAAFRYTRLGLEREQDMQDREGTNRE